MRLICTALALLGVFGACRSSSKEKERALALLDERHFCEGLQRYLTMRLPTVGELGDLEARTVAALMYSVLFCTAPTEHDAARKAMRELERASPDCFKKPLDQVAQLRAQKRVLDILERGSPAHESGAKPRPKEKQQLCSRLLQLFERGRRAAKRPRPNDSDRVIWTMPYALRDATRFCSTEEDRAVPRPFPFQGPHGAARSALPMLGWAEHLLRSAEMCAPPAKSSFNADIVKERQGLDLMIDILRRGSANRAGSN